MKNVSSGERLSSHSSAIPLMPGLGLGPFTMFDCEDCGMAKAKARIDEKQINLVTATKISILLLSRLACLACLSCLALLCLVLNCRVVSCRVLWFDCYLVLYMKTPEWLGVSGICSGPWLSSSCLTEAVFVLSFLVLVAWWWCGVFLVLSCVSCRGLSWLVSHAGA
jgi:hypothetical protein